MKQNILMVLSNCANGCKKKRRFFKNTELHYVVLNNIFVVIDFGMISLK